jgi:hypothetical protein
MLLPLATPCQLGMNCRPIPTDTFTERESGTVGQDTNLDAVVTFAQLRTQEGLRAPVTVCEHDRMCYAGYGLAHD